jgi:hypothetical protein
VHVILLRGMHGNLRWGQSEDQAIRRRHQHA